MLPISIEAPYIHRRDDRVWQGDILRDVQIIEVTSPDESGKQPPVGLTELPYIIVISQDCDLMQDYTNRSLTTTEKHDKYIPSVLVCPAYLADKFRTGRHLEEIGLTMEQWNRKKYQDIKIQENKRFHFLEAFSPLQIPNLVVDFKHYFTIQRNTLYSMIQGHYLASLNFLFREELSQRFTSYLGRIGIPESPIDELSVAEDDGSGPDRITVS